MNLVFQTSLSTQPRSPADGKLAEVFWCWFLQSPDCVIHKVHSAFMLHPTLTFLLIPVNERLRLSRHLTATLVPFSRKGEVGEHGVDCHCARHHTLGTFTALGNSPDAPIYQYPPHLSSVQPCACSHAQQCSRRLLVTHRIAGAST